MRTDFLGNEVQVGDKVVFMQRHYRDLLMGEIVKLTAQTVLILYKEAGTTMCQLVRQTYKQIVKVP